LLRHLTNALLLGQTPLVLNEAPLGFRTLAHVVLMNSTSLTKDALRAVSFFWAIKPVDMPSVHPSRLAAVDSHLRSVKMNETHSFRKCHGAIRITHTEFVIISDLGLLESSYTVANNIAKLFYPERERLRSFLQMFGACDVEDGFPLLFRGLSCRGFAEIGLMIKKACAISQGVVLLRHRGAVSGFGGQVQTTHGR
jgi:hypothetical protein